jgi:hypothetical protein
VRHLQHPERNKAPRYQRRGDPCNNADAGQSTPFGFPLLICTKTVYLEHWTRRSRALLTSKPKSEPFWPEFKATWQKKNQNLL